MKKKLDRLYKQYNRRRYVHPDPLWFLYRYDDVRDREIAGLVASSLAYGRVKQILENVSKVLETMGRSPRGFLERSSFRSLSDVFKDFRYRFAAGNHMAALLWATKMTIDRFGSLNACFSNGMSLEDETVIPGMAFLSKNLSSGRDTGHLIAHPEKGSACKRMNLFLRWMVRKDEVDPGGWEGISPSKLIIPLDTHMHTISLGLGLTNKKQANMRTALEITSGFKNLAPDDPVKYDFALTRFGIRDDMNMDDLLLTVSALK